MAVMEKQKKLRSCVACSKQDVKLHLYRLVRDGQGSVSFDASGKKAGRGAYVCSQACFEKARKSHRLERSLRAKINGADYDRIAEELASQCVDDRIR